MSKVALPIENGRLCSLFEEANQFRVFTTEDRKTIDEKLLTVPQHQSGHVPFWLYKYGVTDVFVNRISHESIHKFNRLKINVFVGVKLQSPEVLIEEHLCGALETNGSFVDK
jgi:predicted Fe-Mo cluster-binding NifX family protein